MTKKGGRGYCSICQCSVNNISFHRSHAHKSRPYEKLETKDPRKQNLRPKANTVKSIQDKISKLNKKIQGECKHEPWMVDVKYNADTGNYDPSCDSFWTECYCQSCGKAWREEGQDRRYYASKKEWECHMEYLDRLDRVTKRQKKTEKEFGMTKNPKNETVFFHKNHTDW